MSTGGDGLFVRNRITNMLFAYYNSLSGCSEFASGFSNYL